MYKRKRDKYGKLDFSNIILAKPGKRLYTVLNGVDHTTVSATRKCNNLSTLTFEVDRYIDIDGEYVESNAYHDIEELMELYCDGIWFIISQPPRIVFDGWKERKTIEAESYEVRLQQFVLNNFYINLGREDSQEMIYATEHDPALSYQVKFCDKTNEKLSLLHLVLSHAGVKGWTIGYVDDITVNETDGSTLLPDEVSFFEVDTCSVYSFLTQQVSQAFSCIFVFDTENLTINAYRAESLGDNTNIVLSYRNVQNTLTKTRDNQLVTAFKVSGADDINIDYVNFGTNIIFNYDYFMREPYMNAKLAGKVKAWVAYREEQRPIYIDLSKQYNENLEILSEIENRVPVDTAQNDWFAVKLEDLKIAYADNTAIVRGLEALYVDKEGQFDLEAMKKSHDWPLYESTMNYTLPAIVAALQAKGDKVEGYGTGNIISNVNPVTLDKDWLMIGADKAEVTPEQIQDSPAYGITRSMKITFSGSGIAGVTQQNITVEKQQEYVLSCYAKGSGTINLEYGKTGDERTQHSFVLSSVWARVFVSFTTPAKLIHIAFTGDSNFEICGMQLEMGTNPSQFGFFLQNETAIKAWETDWKLYGIKELETKISVYENSIETLEKNGYSVPYSPLSQFSEDYHTQMYQKYKDLLKLKSEAETALEERRTEYEAAKIPEIQKRREEIARNVEAENFCKNGAYSISYNISDDGNLSFNDFAIPIIDENGNLTFPYGITSVVDSNGTLSLEFTIEPFTDKELFVLNSLYNEHEYVNENILITTLDDLGDAVIDKQKLLYDDAVDRLFVESQPQYSYENDVDSIYALPEFAEFDGDLDVGNFLRIENEDGRFVKMRCTEITYNPCSWDSTMNLVFSDMVRYKTKRSDVASLIADIESGSRKGQIVDAGKSKDITEYSFTTEAIKKLFSNPLFQSMIGGITVGGAGSGGTINAEVIIAELVKAKEGIFDKLTADTAFIKYLDVTLVNADKIVTKVLEADKAKIEELAATIINAHEISADIANIKNLLSGHAGIGTLEAINITADNVKIADAVIKDLIAARISVADLMAHTATAELITLISSDGKPTIAFANSTQQFYDNEGRVRVQIGQDGEGKFNFVIIGEDGSNAIFDEKGVTQNGIRENTIITKMIADGQITPNKASWKVDVDSEGNQITSIENIYMGNGDKFGVRYAEIIDTIDGQSKTINEIQSTVDEQEKKISDRVSKSEIDTYIEGNKTVTEMHDSIAEQVIELGKITTSVTDMNIRMDGIDDSIEANTTLIEQTADKLSLIATGGDGESSIVLTETFISLVSSGIVGIKAQELNIDSVATFMNSLIDGSKTIINAGSISTDNVNALLIRTGRLTSANFQDSVTTVYATEGTSIDMNNGAIKAKNFAIDNNGNAFFKGTGNFEGKIVANEGQIGGINGFTIQSQKLYSGMTSFTDTTHDGVYIGTNGIALGKGKFKVGSDGVVNATGGVFNGTITAQAGSSFGPWHISNDSIWNGSSVFGSSNGLYFGTSGLSIKSNFKVDSNGRLTALQGLIGGFEITTNSLYHTQNAFGGNGVYVSPNGISVGDKFKASADGVDVIGKICATSITAKDSYSIYYNNQYDGTIFPNSKTFARGALDYEDGMVNFSSLTIGEDIDGENSSESCVTFQRTRLGDTTTFIYGQNIIMMDARSNGKIYGILDATYDKFVVCSTKLCLQEGDGYGASEIDVLRGITNDAGYGIWTNGKSPSTGTPCVYGASSRTGYTSDGIVDLGFSGGAFKTLYVKGISLNGDYRTEWPNEGKSAIVWRPSVSSSGVISWTNNNSSSVPSSVNIKGPKGDPGTNGIDGSRGPQGPQGIQGPKGDGTADGVNISPLHITIAKGNALRIRDVNNSIRGMISIDDTNTGLLGNPNINITIQGKTVHSMANVISDSDVRLKKDFRNLDIYENFFMDIEPVSFRFKTETSNKYHIGVKAQQVLESLEKNGLSKDDFAGYDESVFNKNLYSNINDIPNFDIVCGIGYTEFTSLNTYMTQKAHHRLDFHDSEINELKTKNIQLLNICMQLQGEIAILKQQMEEHGIC